MGAGRILVVEDDQGMREAIESLLDAAGYTTTVYESAEALLAGCCLEGTLCVISDIRLAAMSGLELVTELRERSTHLPVILITAHDTPDARREAGQRGAAGYVPKPFAGNALLAAINAAVN